MSTIFVSGFISLSVQSNFMLFEWNMATTEEKENIARTLTEYGQDWWKMEWMIYSTYTGDCMCFPELVDGSVEDGHSKDESPVYEVDEKSRRIPERTRKLHPSRSLGLEEVFQVKPEFRIRWIQGWEHPWSQMENARGENDSEDEKNWNDIDSKWEKKYWESVCI